MYVGMKIPEKREVTKNPFVIRVIKKSTNKFLDYRPFIVRSYNISLKIQPRRI